MATDKYDKIGQMKAECHCGRVSVAVIPEVAWDGRTGGNETALCHCASCRHTTGQLFTSYVQVLPMAGPDPGIAAEYTCADGWTRLFCPTCGCHVLQTGVWSGAKKWLVATGVLAGPADPDDGKDQAQIILRNHAGAKSTGDGGASVWLTEMDGEEMRHLRGADDEPTTAPAPPSAPGGTLPASCDCGRVSFHLTRPDESSRLPTSYLPDLTHAYCSTDLSVIANPSDTKWWLRRGDRYLAGTCACRTCRLTSGFEIQTWAFVPRSNIHFHLPRKDDGSSTAAVPLDFDTLPAGILSSYGSSPDVVREFCGGCGATVFWRGRRRPELIDVSVGLLRGDGARAEAWLDWWAGRVSFSEEAVKGREGAEAERVRALISSLERGLKRWKGE